MTKHEDKMAGCLLGSFFASLLTESKVDLNAKQKKKNEANIHPAMMTEQA